MSAFQFYTELILFLFFAIPASIIDVRSFRIPDAITFPGCAALIIQLFFWDRTSLGDALIAAAVGFAILFIIHWVTKGLGMGDVKYALFIGLFCGLRTTFIAFFIAAVSGMLVAIILLVTKTLSRKDPLSFAPFLTFGAISAKFLVYFYNFPSSHFLE